MYHVLEGEIGIHMIGSVVERDIPLRVKYASGEPIPAEERPIGARVVLEEGPETLPDLFVLGGNPIVSARFVSALEQADVDNIEFYPTPIERKDGVVSVGYGVLNIVGLVDCIDRQRSLYTTYAGSIFRLKHLELDETLIPDLLLFRPIDYELLMLVHERLAAALTGFTGVVLSPASGWNDNHIF
jgi:hypothetical protein